LELPDDAWLEAAAEDAGLEAAAEAAQAKVFTEVTKPEVRLPSGSHSRTTVQTPTGAGTSSQAVAPVRAEAAAAQPQAVQEASTQRLADQYHMPVQDVLEVQEQFRALDRTGCGEIGPEEFRQLIESRMTAKVSLEAPEAAQLSGVLQRWTRPLTHGAEPPMRSNLDEAPLAADLSKVLQWLSIHAFDQKMLLPPRQRFIRRLAQKWDESFPDVEDVFKAFDSFDNDGSGEICQHEFGELLRVLLKIPKSIEFPHSRIEYFWREVDRDRDGKISDEDFFLWFRREFGIGPDPHGPWSKYYHKPFVPNK